MKNSSASLALRQPTPVSNSERKLILTLAIVVLSFIASTAYSQYWALSISGAALDIEGNAAPSIEHLAAARTELHRLALMMDNYVDERLAGRPADERPLRVSRREIRDDFERYFVLQTFPAERDQWQRLHQELGRLDDAMGRTLSQVSKNDLLEAGLTVKREFNQAVNGLSDAILTLIEFNARLAHDRALIIERMHRRSLVLAVTLDLIALVMATLAALALLRAMRHYAAIVAEHTDLLWQRADELDQFAARVAHDIQNPLATVHLALVLAQGAGNLESMRGAVVRGMRSLGRASQIVRDLLSFARAAASADPGATTSIEEVISGVVEDLRSVAEVEQVQLHVDPLPACAVACTSGILVCLVSNLVHNALKYIGDSPERRITIRVLARGDRVRFEVEDTGAGLEPALRELVFQPYVRGAGLTQPGLGLGLATVKRICDTHHGAVGVGPGAKRGCVFWFELPAAASPAIGSTAITV